MVSYESMIPEREQHETEGLRAWSKLMSERYQDCRPVATSYSVLEWERGWVPPSKTHAAEIDLAHRQARPFPDPLVKVYDLRTMRALPPIPSSSGPAFIHALPKRSSSIAVASAQGLINVVDAANPSKVGEFYQASHYSDTRAPHSSLQLSSM